MLRNESEQFKEYFKIKQMGEFKIKFLIEKGFNIDEFNAKIKNEVWVQSDNLYDDIIIEANEKKAILGHFLNKFVIGKIFKVLTYRQEIFNSNKDEVWAIYKPQKGLTACTNEIEKIEKLLKYYNFIEMNF